MASAAYLAKMYGSDADQPKKKRRKKKDGKKSKKANSLRVFDDDPEWGRGLSDQNAHDDDESGPVVVEEEEIVEKPELPQVRLAEDERQGWEEVNDGDEADKSDPSPPRRRHDSDADNSDASPPQQRHDSDVENSDASPPRRRHDSDADHSAASPPRRRHDSDAEESDASLPRRRNDSDQSEASPPRRPHGGEAEDSDASPPRRRDDDDDDQSDSSPPRRKTMSGLTAGLRNPEQLKKELNKRRDQERNKLADADAVLSGANAATVVRDKRGKKMDAYEQMQMQQAGEVDPDEGKHEWGGGKAQLDEKARMQKRLEEEKSAPFAKSKDDLELNRDQREQDRWGDPMLAYVQKKRAGNIPQSKRKCPFVGPTNRFNLQPGFHWDGVDRSNGFEAKVVNHKYAKKQANIQSYHDGCADM